MKNIIHIFGASGSGTTMARLCLSAFARVATRTAASIRPSVSSLPQRIRAGCDCGKAMQRTANLLREGR